MLGLALGGNAGANDATASVRFSNNDQLAGSLDQLTTELLVWKSPALAKPTPFFLRSVMDITLPAAQSADTTEPEATLKLTNGDTVSGQLGAVTEQTIALDTWFAGRMIFNRMMVGGVKIAEKSAFTYYGPTGLDGWRQATDPPAWTYQQGAIRSHAVGSIARDHVLPDECSISFDVAWKGDALGLKVIAFSNDMTTDSPPSGYEVAFQRGTIYLRNCRIQSFLGTASAQVLMESDKAHIEIRGSQKSGKVCLLINDRVIESWTDPDVGKGQFGHGLHFLSQNATPLRISKIGVAAWDGAEERPPEPRAAILRQPGEEPKPAEQEQAKEWRLALANGDSLRGEVLAIDAGMMTVKSPLGEIKVPLARLRTLALPKADLERCKRRNGDVRAWFADGSSIVFQLDGVGDATLLGSSQNFGSATFKIAAFSRIEFNIHDPDLEDKRSLGEW
jgi:hypothetical protein